MFGLLVLSLCSLSVLGRFNLGKSTDRPPTNYRAAKEILSKASPSGVTVNPVDILGFSGTSGYSVVNTTTGSALFYWQINKNGTDIKTDTADPTPLILWFEGGPGCASVGSLFFEMGPWLYNDTTGALQVRNNTWLYDYHMLFIDAPIGTGYSIVGPGDQYIMTSQQYAQQMYTALQNLALENPTWFQASRPLYFFGESYAGHWIPWTAQYVLQQNAIVGITGNVYLPLAGIAVGDGWVDPINQIGFYSDAAFSVGLIDEDTRDNITYYEQMAVSQINAGFYNESSVLFMEILGLFQYFTGGVNSTACGANIYDMRVYCDYSWSYDAWLVNNVNKAMLGVPLSIEYQDCNPYIFTLMGVDIAKSVTAQLIYDLQHLPVMFWTGQDDYIVNYLCSLNWMANLDWPGQEGYLNAPKYSWSVGGEIVGFTRSYGKLTQVTVLKAGHLTAHDQILPSRDMVDRFITGRGFQD